MFQLIFPTVSCLKILSEGRCYFIFIYISLSFHLYRVCFEALHVYFIFLYHFGSTTMEGMLFL